MAKLTALGRIAESATLANNARWNAKDRGNTTHEAYKEGEDYRNNSESEEEVMSIFNEAAAALGWVWSPAHDGFISENHRNRPNEDRNGYGSYEVAADAEEACFWDGIETEDAARRELSRFVGEL